MPRRPDLSKPRPKPPKRPAVSSQAGLPAAPMRLNRYIAQCGAASRRGAESLIAEGRILLNGKPVSDPARAVSPGKDTVTLDGKPLGLPRRATTVLLHKPPGLITTRADDKNRQTIYKCLPEKYLRLKPVGRLDRDSSGLLILTDDGALHQQLAKPSKIAPLLKVYRVDIDTPFHKPHAKQLLEGVALEGEKNPARVTEISLVAPTTLELKLETGLNRQIRRSLEAMGYTVTRLKRTAFGPLTLGHLAPGQWRPLKPAELASLQPAPARPAPQRQKPKKPSVTPAIFR